jgi:hypothetical protein
VLKGKTFLRFGKFSLIFIEYISYPFGIHLSSFFSAHILYRKPFGDIYKLWEFKGISVIRLDIAILVVHKGSTKKGGVRQRIGG